MKSGISYVRNALRYLARKLQRVSTKIAILVFRLFQILQTRSMPSSKLHLISIDRGSSYFRAELFDLAESALFPRMRKIRTETIQQLPKNGLPEGCPRALKRLLKITKKKRLHKTGYMGLEDFCIQVLAIEAPDVLAATRLRGTNVVNEFSEHPLGSYHQKLAVIYTVTN